MRKNSGAKNTGKYVLDDRSAVLAINKNKGKTGTATSDYSPAPSDSAPKKKHRILSPRAQAQESLASNNAISAPSQTTSSTTDILSDSKLIYKQPKITPAEFLDDAKKMMADSRIKTAIVFTFFQDFVTDGSAPLQQYSELLSHLWDEYTLNSNENICIFLAPQMDANSISHLFDNLASGDVLRGRFFNDNKTINRSCTIHIGLPNQDEFRYINGEKIHHTISPKLGERCRTDKSIYYTLDFDVTPHLLRHTYITNLIHEGVDPKTVQYLAGHENSKVTMDIYAKVKYNKPWELAAVVNEAFQPSTEYRESPAS